MAQFSCRCQHWFASRVELGLRDLVIAGDWLVRTGRATLPEVQEALAGVSGRGCGNARRAAELVRKPVESPRETGLRLVVVLAGLPEPECNVELGDEWFFLGRVDLYLRAWNLALEYEGDQHRTDPGTYAKDLTRSEDLTASGVGMIGSPRSTCVTPAPSSGGCIEHWSLAATTARHRGSGPSGLSPSVERALPMPPEPPDRAGVLDRCDFGVWA